MREEVDRHPGQQVEQDEVPEQRKSSDQLVCVTGLGPVAIADKLGISRSSVQRILRAA